jgi:hypothetical protein
MVEGHQARQVGRHELGWDCNTDEAQGRCEGVEGWPVDQKRGQDHGQRWSTVQRVAAVLNG